MVVLSEATVGGSFMNFRLRIRQYIFVLCGLFLVLLIPRSSSAKDQKLLRLFVEPLGTSSSVRSNSATALECRLGYSASRLLEGHLRLELFDQKERIGIVQVNDLVLSGGDYEFTAMLPPLNYDNKSIEIRPTFVEDGRPIVMDAVSLIFPSSRQRGMVAMFVVDDPSFKTATQKNLRSILSPNRFNPLRGVSVSESDTLNFYAAHYEATEVPISAIRFCSADIVVICNASLGRLREKQLAAMEEWVQAGGVACIVPDGVLNVEHLSFLDRLTNVAKRGREPFIAKDDGLLGRDFEKPGYEINEFGLGRVAVISPELDLSSLTVPEIAALNGFMWRIRAWHLGPMSKGTWPRWVGDDGYQHQKIPAISGMIRRGLPSGVQVIPIGVVGALLVLYVLVIGPGDYFVLGLFRLRKFTWFVFPLVTLAFTLFTVWLSHHYMGGVDPGKPLIFVDVVEGNKVARSSEFCLIFSASQRQVTRKFTNAIATPLDKDDFVILQGSVIDSRDTGRNITSYSGRFPSNYQMDQSIEQWSPQLNRVFRIAPSVQLPAFDWDFYKPQIGQSFSAGLAQRVRTGFGPNTSAILFHGEQVIPLMDGSVGPLFADEYVDDPYGFRQWMANGQRPRVNVLHEMCVRSPVQWFKAVSQVSPTGADNFEDMTLLDSTDNRQWLLVVITEDKDAIRIYRRLYKVGDAAPAEPPGRPVPMMPGMRFLVPNRNVRGN